MQNAHLRFAKLLFQSIGEKRSTSITVTLDRLVADPQPADGDTSHRAHLLSVVGTDAEIGAISAAISKSSTFTVFARTREPIRVYLERDTQCFKGTVTLAGRNRPMRHLVAISKTWTEPLTAANPEQAYMLDASPDFIWTNVAYVYGLPARPEWATWFYHHLETANALVPLIGIGCDPVLVRGQRDQFLDWLGQGVAAKELVFPSENGSIAWPRITLRDLLLPIETPQDQAV